MAYGLFPRVMESCSGDKFVEFAKTPKLIVPTVSLSTRPHYRKFLHFTKTTSTATTTAATTATATAAANANTTTTTNNRFSPLLTLTVQIARLTLTNSGSGGGVRNTSTVTATITCHFSNQFSSRITHLGVGCSLWLLTPLISFECF